MILITNDDGIYAEGLLALAKELGSIDELLIVAPFEEQSAVGHAITLSEPLRLRRVKLNEDIFGWATSGRPADAVKLGVKVLTKITPSLIISGINLGENVGASLIYSGTVSAATEGTLLGIPSIAISIPFSRNPDYRPAAKFALHLARLVLANGLPQGVLLNVNVPGLPLDKIKGVKVTRQGKTYFADFFEERIDPHGGKYYWMGGSVVSLEESEDTDFEALSRGYISITPVHYDLTAYQFMETLRSWNLKLPV
jgi:5'-nucleotidase